MNVSIQNILIPSGQNYDRIDVQIIGRQISAVSAASSSSDQTALANSAENAPNILPDTIPTIIDGRNKLLLPGFVNGHTHSSQVWQRGLIRQLPLELWLANIMDSTVTDLEQLYLSALSTAVDTLMSGGTCVMDHAYLAPNAELESVAALVKAYKQVGIRAFIAPLIQDQPFVAGLPAGQSLPHRAYPRPTSEILEIMEAIVEQFHQPEAGIYIAVGPTGFHRCSDALLIGCAELSERYNLCRHMHLLETRTQKLLAQERYGVSAVEHLQQLGFLDHRTSLAHGVWLDEADIEILAHTGSTVVHNPVSNLRLGSGIAPVLKYLKAGVNVCFGCDGAASNDAQNLLEAIKLGTILHTVTDPDYHSWLTPQAAVAMATQGGAQSVNLAEQMGSISVGKMADLVIYDLTHPSLLPCTDPLQLLILGRPTDFVDCIWINGRLLVEQGKVLTVDLDDLNQALREHTRAHLREPHSASNFKTIQQVEPHYRSVLDLPIQ